MKRPSTRALIEARASLRSAGLTDAHCDTITGLGLRRSDACAAEAPIVVKVAAGALTLDGAREAIAAGLAAAILRKITGPMHVRALRACAAAPSELDWPTACVLEADRLVRPVFDPRLRVFVATELGAAVLAALPPEQPT